MSLTDNMIFLHKHQFKLTYKFELSTTMNHHELKDKCQALFKIVHGFFDFYFKFYYDNKCYFVYIFKNNIYINYVDLNDKVIQYLLNILDIKVYTKRVVKTCITSTLNMKIDKKLLICDILTTRKNNITLDLDLETHINKKHGGLCIKGQELSEIIDVYTSIYTSIKLPIVLHLLFNTKKSWFYILPYELKNVILYFIN